MPSIGPCCCAPSPPPPCCRSPPGRWPVRAVRPLRSGPTGWWWWWATRWPATTASAPETGTDPADLARPELPATGSAPAVPAAAALAAALLLAGLALLRRRRG
ncbi:LPXTG cell wall anchor domain-containing protein [Kitasatospora gansuensis]|uniref:LPXTG cell wall anchor domain-containing protein n=1 Tax=Kitasatospora gansuensis TaxID=258050 RepID=UPI00160DBC00